MKRTIEGPERIFGMCVGVVLAVLWLAAIPFRLLDRFASRSRSEQAKMAELRGTSGPGTHAGARA